MKNMIKNLIAIVYFLLAVFITSYLIFMNDFGVSVINDFSFFTFKDGIHDGKSLFILEKNIENIAKEDVIYFYNSYSSKGDITYSVVKDINYLNEKETTFQLEKDLFLSSDYLIGSKNDLIELKYAGLVFNFFSNSFIYFLTFLIPSFIFILVQIKLMKK